MADENTPRLAYLAAMAGEETTLPPADTRDLKWMAKILGQDVETEPVQSPEEAYLKAIYENGGGGGGGSSVTVEQLNVTKNGTTTAPSGKAYSPVVVAVPNTYTSAMAGKVVRSQGGSGYTLAAQTARAAAITENGTYTTTYNNSVTVNVPNPSTGTLEITEDGTYDVTNYASVTVSVGGGGGGGGGTFYLYEADYYEQQEVDTFVDPNQRNFYWIGAGVTSTQLGHASGSLDYENEDRLEFNQDLFVDSGTVAGLSGYWAYYPNSTIAIFATNSNGFYFSPGAAYALYQDQREENELFTYGEVTV